MMQNKKKLLAFMATFACVLTAGGVYTTVENDNFFRVTADAQTKTAPSIPLRYS